MNTETQRGDASNDISDFAESYLESIRESAKSNRKELEKAVSRLSADLEEQQDELNYWEMVCQVLENTKYSTGGSITLKEFLLLIDEAATNDVKEEEAK